MKKILIIAFLFSNVQWLFAQEQTYFVQLTNVQTDSIKVLFRTSTNDSLRMKLARYLGLHNQEKNRDTSLYYTLQQLQLAKKLNQRLWEADAYDAAGWLLSQLKNYPLSFTYLLNARKIAEEKSTEENIWGLEWFSPKLDARYARMTSLGFIYNDLSQLYYQMGDKKRELFQLYEGLKIGTIINNNELLGLLRSNLSQAYVNMNKPDSAIFFGEQALANMRQSGYKTYEGHQLKLIGEAYVSKKDFVTARKYLDESIIVNRTNLSTVKLPEAYFPYAEIFNSLNKPDSSNYYLRKALTEYRLLGDYENVKKAYISLYELYTVLGKQDSSFHYLNLYRLLSDSLNKVEKDKILAYQNVAFDEQIALQNKESLKIKKANTNRTYAFISGILILLAIAFLLFRNNRIRRKANELLTIQKKKIELQKLQVESTLSDLKITQKQLIQSEKMASLGELTAGIAHEIQNPLNFVNNFSEVSVELTKEMVEEVEKGNTEEVKAIAGDLIANLEKINHHGKRADAIVKGMLQHSSSGNGRKEPTDINKLADEYLRLAYHGLRAKDKSFNATLKTEYDESISMINIVPQDMGRVILNLITNAFYATNEKAKLDFDIYEPTVTVKTKRLDPTSGDGGKIEIRVTDNGNGIPQKILDKIFHPFFTTKPTGQGTGLGLSLAYDIIKAHGGELKVETKEGEGSEFIIQLPIV
jgi:two-component system, NtrC family, sensor kinase